MGTLFDQPIRQSLYIEEQDILNYIEILTKISTKTKLPLDQVIKIAEIKQLERRNNLYVSNGDVHDEQMSGLGDLLNKIAANIERLANAAENEGT